MTAIFNCHLYRWGKGLSSEDCILILGRHFSGESQQRLSHEYGIPRTVFASQIRQNQQLVAAAMAAAESFYQMHPLKRPTCRTSTHPARTKISSDAAEFLTAKSPAIMTTQQSVVSTTMMAQQPRPFKPGGEPLMTARLSEVTAMMTAQQAIPQKQTVVPHTTVPPSKIQTSEHEVIASQNNFLAHRLDSGQFHSVHANQRLHLLSSNVQHQTDRILPLVESMGGYNHAINDSLIQQDLRDRVEYRAQGSCAAIALLNKLSIRLICTVDMCKNIKKSDFERIGITSDEVDILVLSDDEWKSRHEWIETTIRDMPEHIRSFKLLIEIFRRKIKEAQITTLEHLLSRYDKIGLPFVVEVWLRDFALSSATAEIRDRLDRGSSDEENFGHESHDYGDHDTLDEATRRDAESIVNQIEKTRGSPGLEEISLIQHGAQQDSEQQQGSDDSGPQASAEKCSAMAQDQEKSFPGLQGALLHSPEPLDSELPQSSEDLRQQDADKICSGTGERCQARSQDDGDGPCSGHARRDSLENAAAAVLIDMLSQASAAAAQDNSASDPSAASARGSIAALVDTDTDEAIQRLQSLQRIVGKCFPNTVSNGCGNGHTGTLKPKSAATVLVHMIKALPPSDREKAGLVDLGCSAGHFLVLGALSESFVDIIGIDLPVNKDSIENNFEQFRIRAGKHKKLGQYLETIQKIQFRFDDLANEGAPSLNNVLAGSGSCAIFWFSAGFSERDLEKIGARIARSSNVKVVGVVPRHQAQNAERILADLNSCQGKPEFRIVQKFKVDMSGNGSFTAYIMARDNNIQFDMSDVTLQGSSRQPSELRSRPSAGCTVEMIHNCGTWYRGIVSLDSQTREELHIEFSDGDTADVPIYNPDLFFLPIEGNKWEDRGRIHGRIPAKFCTLCAEALESKASVHCARCGSTGFHLKCCGYPEQAPPSGDFVCPLCRCELAELGKSQAVQHRWQTEGTFCFGCGDAVHDEEFDLCDFCNGPYGFCCSARTIVSKGPFRCPACIGISTYDAAVDVWQKHSLDKVRSIIQNFASEKKKGKKEEKKITETISGREEMIMDQYARSVATLQNTCQWGLLRNGLGVLMDMTRLQIRLEMNPSIADFSLLNLLGIPGGPDLELLQQVSELHVTHALRASNKTPFTDYAPFWQKGRLKFAFMTADMRNTPWWDLMKKSLIELAQCYELFIYSRPGVEFIQGDPHYVELMKHAKIRNFSENTTDFVVARTIHGDGVDVLMDAGGPTYRGSTGVMALRPAPIQGAHLGWPGLQPGGHVDFSVVDPHVLPPGSPQALGAQERLMFTSCYQPNASFESTISIPEAPSAPPTTRACWSLPEDGFVFAFFCRPGRITSELAKAFANILLRVDKSSLWIRKTPQPAFARLRRFFSEQGIDSGRIVPADDVPNNVHVERIRHADMVLDSDLYGGHTTCSDSLRAGVLYLVLKGKWFHGRVAYSLVYNIFGDCELLCADLMELQARAVYFATDAGKNKLEDFRTSLRETLAQRSSIFDGKKWINAFQRGIGEYARRFREKEPFVDVYTTEFPVPDTDRKWILVPETQGLGMVAEQACARPGGAGPMDEDVEVLACGQREGAKRPHDEDELSKNCPKRPCPDPVQGSAPAQSESDSSQKYLKAAARARSCRIEWLFDLTKKDRQEAMRKAVEYLATKGIEVVVYKDEATGEEMPGIQLPCIIPLYGSSTGKEIGSMELPFLYVKKGEFGDHLFLGQRVVKGMYITRYDGKLLEKKEVIVFTYCRALNNHQTVDGIGHGKVSQVKNNSLGHVINHKWQRSLAKYVNRLVLAPVSGARESIFVQAKYPGEAHEEVTTFYTSGSAQRHGIPRHVVQPGTNLIKESARQRHGRDITDAVEMAMDVLLEDAGLDLHRICGAGSNGVVLEVGFRGSRYAIKLDKCSYHSYVRMGVLVEAAVLGVIERRRENDRAGFFSVSLVREFGWTSGSALINGGPNLRVSAVAMELMDRCAGDIWRKFEERFLSGECGQLLRDMQSVLRGTFQAVAWMHDSDLAHGDLKPDNILLKRLDRRPSDWRVAFCEVGGEVYQVIIGDWGTARWSGEGTDAKHVFTKSIHSHNSLTIEDLAKREDRIVPVGTKELQVAFGFRAKKSHEIVHPGFGTFWIRAPGFDRKFQDGQGAEQRRFDQAADIWAVGATGVRIVAPITETREAHVAWATALHDASKCTVTKLQAQEKRARECEAALKSATPRARGALARAETNQRPRPSSSAGAQASCGGSWLAHMVSQRYTDSLWPILSACMSEQSSIPDWKSLLQLLEGCLAFSSSSRFTAKQALQHAFFRESG